MSRVSAASSLPGGDLGTKRVRQLGHERARESTAWVEKPVSVQCLIAQVGAGVGSPRALAVRTSMMYANIERFCFANNLLRVSLALSTFSTSPSVEPTNNAAERGLRGAVIYRKLSLGQYDLKTSKSLAVGTHALAIKVSAPDGSGVVNTNGTMITS